MTAAKSKKPEGEDKRPGPSLRDLLRGLEEDPGEILKTFPHLPFADQLSVLLLTSGALRQDLLLSSPLAGKLVSSLPDQEVYLTVKEIGFEDALPMLSLMSREQLRYLNDLEAWDKARFEAPAFLKLIRLIHQCGEDKLAAWLSAVDPELLVLLLKDYGSVSKFDVTADPMEDATPHTAITQDGYYHYLPNQRDFAPLINPVLRILKATNPERYGMVMESAYVDPPAEVEEEALRFRSGRLAEKGMPEFEEACEIYRPLTDERFLELTAHTPPSTPAPSPQTLALYPVRWLPAGSFFREALAAAGDHPEADRIRVELASLGNKVLIAGGMDATSPESLKAALKKVADTLTLALEHLADRNVDEAASWLTRAWLHHLFQLGVSQVWRLSERARRLRDRAGFPWIDRFHLLADSPLDDTLLGLLRPRPLYCEGHGPGGAAEFREFAGMQDVRTTAARLAATEALADLFSDALRFSPEKIKETCLEAGLGDQLDRVKWSQILQTTWVLQRLTGQEVFRPLTLEEVSRFLRDAFAGAPGTPERRLEPSFTGSLQLWVSDRTGALEGEAGEILQEWIEAGGRQIEEELAGLDPEKPVDSRFVRCLCIHPKSLDEGQR